MLPESQFPVTGGIMQTEEVVPCARSTGLDELATTERLHSSQQPAPPSPLLFCTAPPAPASSSLQALHHPPYAPLASSMAVKQEPQEHEDERARQSGTLSAPSEHEDTQVEQHECPSAAASGQSSPEPEVPAVVQPSAACQQNGCKKPARKSRWKLKFHHQALPPEYLDHYEAALAQEAALGGSATPTSPSPAPQPAPAASLDVQSWLQRLAAMQSELHPGPAPSPSQPQLAASSRRSVITSTQHLQQQQQQPRPPMKYSDLPYMGEITLDNCKPRRGRKPKKADICHLIYKNYGTILPGTPGLEDRARLPRQRLDVAGGKEPAATACAFQRTDIQNRISSLLEKRLTQERRALESAVEQQQQQQQEPMNLCIRDLDLPKIRDRQPSAFGSCNSRSGGSSDAEDAECLGPSTPEHDRQPERGEADGQPFGGNDGGESNGLDDSTPKPSPSSACWPSDRVFLQPAALQSQLAYYRKLAQDGGPKPEPPREQQQQQQQQRLVPKSLYCMLESHKAAASEPAIPEAGACAPPPPRAKRNCSSSQSQPAKRKRSAIFIPPMPTENNNNPATEVSICKFKFTGGARPSLQEKKSLSVDSGGNFRYYSGTGDKSMRGYEFFPREALQQPANQPASSGASGSSSSGAFLSAAAERGQAAASACPPRPVSACSADDGRNRKTRKTRKSVQREKLEQTFKEKGFLIQTQQLESAEGATYCKFRQLRKFTRYLFRSWKDYLPGELTESEAQAAAAAAAATGELQHSSYVEPSVN